MWIIWLLSLFLRRLLIAQNQGDMFSNHEVPSILSLKSLGIEEHTKSLSVISEKFFGKETNKTVKEHFEIQ